MVPKVNHCNKDGFCTATEINQLTCLHYENRFELAACVNKAYDGSCVSVRALVEVKDTKMNLCDREGYCSAADNKDDRCTFFQTGHIEGFCNYHAFNDCCLSKPARRAVFTGF